MPLKPKAQMHYLFMTAPQLAREFAAKTPSIKALPEYAKKKKKRKA